MSERRRGSDKLLEQLGTKPMTISEEVLERLQKAAQSAGGKLLDWRQFGGVVIDGVYGRIRVDTARDAVAVVSAFLLQEGLKVVTETFPYGTPHVDEWVITFRAGTLSVA